MVPGRRSRFRQFHGASLAELTIGSHHQQEKTPGAQAPGVLFSKDCCDQFFAGGPKSSGGASIIGISILILFRSTFSGLSSSAVTVIGKAITNTTMIACSPIQGIAPQ